MTDLTALPWRTWGSGVLCATTAEGGNAGVLACFDAGEVAEAACADHNAMLDLQWLVSAGLTFGIRSGGHEDSPGILVCLDLDGPPLFSGRTLGEAVAKAREWAETEGSAS